MYKLDWIMGAGQVLLSRMLKDLGLSRIIVGLKVSFQWYDGH